MIMIDTSIWIALLDKTDNCHRQAISALNGIYYRDIGICDQIYGETLTVLRNKLHEQKCYEFYKFINDQGVNTMLSDRHVLMLSMHYFFLYRKLSFVDCLLMATAKLNNAELLTFDKSLKKAWDSIGD
ncbi:PIN domain-containing protein [Candidatus Peregrinibacteria bacterium]|nr:PIN domain-containing protein [Candidatus Peregrinibacteria bacterium]